MCSRFMNRDNLFREMFLARFVIILVPRKSDTMLYKPRESYILWCAVYTEYLVLLLFNPFTAVFH